MRPAGYQGRAGYDILVGWVSAMMRTKELWRLPLQAILAESQQLRDERVERGPSASPLRLAILGGFSTQFVARVLDVLLHDSGCDVEIYEAAYDTYVEAILNPDSEFYRFTPQLTLLLVHRGNLAALPALGGSLVETEAMALAEVERWASYWQLIRSRIGTQIIQSNFELPDARPLGSFEAQIAQSELAFVRRVNALLVERARGLVQLFDADYQCASYGLTRALDPSRYHLTKQPYAFEFLPSYCHGLATLVLATQGRSKKCVVLDLDDTLWGGTVGEDGVASLQVGPGHAEGEAFAAFQRYLKALKARGVLLAVCSKNDEQVAREAFEQHPGMELTLQDVACFVANWEDKASSIEAIARRLNLGLDSLVFVDNSAGERHLVRGALPAVRVVELSDDPAEYVRNLDEGRFFEATELTEDAAKRTEYMRADQERSRAAALGVDYASYLRSLELRASLAPIDESNLPRAAELIKRTNQFNLRTVRHSPQQVMQLLAQPGSFGLSLALTDRFGSQGTVALALLVPQQDALFIDTWLMSCRVLKRGVEHCVFEQMLVHARAQGAKRLLGEYRPSGKNGMVAQLFPELGFTKLSEDEAGVTCWELELAQAPAVVEHYIQVANG
jgi:FkbH-like protein